MRQGTIEYGVKVDRKDGKFNGVSGCDVISREYIIKIRLYDTDGFDGTKFRIEDINQDIIQGLEKTVFREMMKDSTLKSRRLSEIKELPYAELDENSDNDSSEKSNNKSDKKSNHNNDLAGQKNLF